MKKRLIAALLTAALLTGALPCALAAAPSQEDAATTLAALDVMVGDSTGNLMLTRPVTRAEFTKMVLAMSAWKDSAGGQTLVSPYPDVPYTHWAASYVETAVQSGLVSGYLDGTFRPGNTITLAEGVTMALRLLGYYDSDFSGVYPSGQMALYRSLKLNEGVAVTANTATLTRQDAMYLLYNLLTAKTKTGTVYLLTLGHTLNAAGEVDLVSLINQAMEGPIVAASGWQSSLPFSVGSAKVYRSGSLSSAASVQNGDVLYWSKSMRTVWAYTSKVTGTYQSASPSTAAPASVMVAGKAYAIETASAAMALSDLGASKTGDTVTLLLGRSGGVAAVQTGSAASSSILIGVVTATGSSSYTDASGNSYSAPTVTFTATDGAQYTYQVSAGSSYAAGDLVQASTSSGTASVKRLSASTSLSGRVSADGSKLGTYTFASDVEILDTYADASLRIYPSRLAGINLQSGVRYYLLNAKGEISRLILDDVTGDLHQYGVVTSSEEYSVGMAVGSAYVYDIGGVTGVYSSASSMLGASVGPARFRFKSGALASVNNLTQVKLSAVSGGTALAGSTTYTLSDTVAVYEVKNASYFPSSLDRVASGYSLVGWYDKAESAGGRIRVITAIALES